ncbi:MAG: SPFH domain-containing protein [Eubacteriales bacterium]|nr:SPFH domain-containing protein [Eubacteriales bacterium]
MSKFVIECPNCGKYVEAKTGFFARKKIVCACGYTIDVRTDKLTSRTCAHCGNDVVFDQSKGAAAKCPVCGEPINTMADQDKTVQFSCAQCGIRLNTSKSATTYICPVCDHVNDVVERLKTEEIKKDGLASIIKYEGDADTLVWKHPIEDFNLGSQLIVHESQEAIFFRDGQALDTFTAGRYTLETQQLPVLEKLYKLPTDTEGTFHSEVYYFNLIHQMAIKWGTPEKINFLEPMTGAPISIGARGVLNFKIANARKLLLKLVGTGGKLTRQDLMADGEGNIRNYFRSLIQLTVSTNLANTITGEKLDILQLDQQKMRLSAAMLTALQASFEEYGLVITEFLIMGIMLPQKGDLGYDALQTILQMRQKDLTKSAIQTETEIKLAELEAKKQLDIRIQENVAEVEIAHRKAVAQKGETSVLEAQYAGQVKVAEATGETQAERLRMQLEMERKLQTAQIEAEEMRLKGYNQKDVMQADVQKAYAGALGQMGANGGGAGGSMLGDIAGLGVTLGAMGSVMGMTKDAMAPMMQMGAQAVAPTATGWNCTCGQTNIASNFCPNCGGKKPEPQNGWNCSACGQQNITTNFCPNCGAKKPVEPAGWNCTACGQQNITSNFCPNCGAKKPAADNGWICPDCGQNEIKTNFCPNCGHKKGE